jgi:phospholipid/cholesterol/gamma-HCH transport system substrate-binding protein
MSRSYLETIVGALVISIALYFVFVLYKSNSMNKVDEEQYTISALFQKIDGIKIGSEVKIAGVKIGSILDSSLDTNSYQAKLTMGIDKKIEIPIDSTAQIVSNGLLGDKYIEIVPGSDSEKVAHGGVLEYTQSSLNIENLINKFVVNPGNDSSEKKDDAKPEQE